VIAKEGRRKEKRKKGDERMTESERILVKEQNICHLAMFTNFSYKL
jgi:hypothetical protein